MTRLVLVSHGGPIGIVYPERRWREAMQELAGRTAFVTGGASGIGFALSRALAEAGMKVMLADIETDALATAVASLRASGWQVNGIACDVTDPRSEERRVGKGCRGRTVGGR